MGLLRWFPYMQDWVMSKDVFSSLRHKTLAEVQGDVLEIGFGTGVNIAFYPEHVHKITAVDIEPSFSSIAKRRVKATKKSVFYRTLDAHSLPIKDATFDSVVSTFTLCSISDTSKVVSEIYRVLKPGGRFFFLEHGKSPDGWVGKIQRWIRPFQKWCCDGCDVTKNFEAIFKKTPLKITHLEKFYLPKIPKPWGYMYQGVGQKG